MRRWVGFAGSFILLVVSLLVAWSWRYERDAGAPSWQMKDLIPVQRPPADAINEDATTGVTLIKSAEGPLPVCSWSLPGDPLVSCLHLRYQLHADDLVMGPRSWSRGRLSIEWIADGASQMMPVIEVDANGPQLIHSQVLQPAHGPARARLWLHHYGVGGHLRLAALEVTPVLERGWWPWLALVLALAWFSWLTLLLGRVCGRGFWASGIAALLVLVLGWLLVLPPANDLKPQRWGMVHHLGEAAPAVVEAPAPSMPPAALLAEPAVPARVRVASQAMPASEPSVVAQLGDTVNDMRRAGYDYGVAKSSSPLQQFMRRCFKRVKPLLHVLVWCLPSLLLTLCLGRRPVLLMGAVLAVGSELGQAIFGYQSDWSDLVDLALNLVGVGLGVLMAWVVVRKRRERRPEAGSRRPEARRRGVTSEK